MSSELELSVTKEQGSVEVSVLHVKGEIDTTNYEEFQSKALELHTGDARHLLIEFSGATFMSSAGLRAIHAIYQVYHDPGDNPKPEDFKSENFKLADVPENILKVIKAIGIDSQIEIYPSVAEGVASF